MNTSRSYKWKPDMLDHRDYKLSIPIKKTGIQPMVDLRPVCPPVFDQGQLGSCTANAIGSAFQFNQIKQKIKDFTPSRLFIYYNERLMEGTVKQDAGAQIRDGIKSIAKQGDCPEKLWEYKIEKFATAPPSSAYKNALLNQALKYERLSGLTQLKGVLDAGYPFVFGMAVYDSFESQQVANTGIVPMPSKKEKLLVGHAVMCVGYKEDTKQFIVRNSWGTDWGDKGYFYLPYAYVINSNLCDDFWVIYSVENGK